MNYIPKSLTRLMSRQLFKLDKHSPTIMVVAGVVGLGATAVVAAKATRNLDPILEVHKQQRAEIGYMVTTKEQKQQITRVYVDTMWELTKLYGPAITLGSISAVSILYGHKVLHGRHAATLAAYSGLARQFEAYRERIRKTLGPQAENDIYRGAHGEWQEDPDHKGEYKMNPAFDDPEQSYLRPWFEQGTAPNWTAHPESNYLFLKGVQQHMNNLLSLRGHVFLNDAYDALHLPRTPEGSIAGWLYESEKGDGHIDFGFMTGNDPQTIAFQQHRTPDVQLNFNIDRDAIWNLI